MKKNSKTLKILMAILFFGLGGILLSGCTDQLSTESSNTEQVTNSNLTEEEDQTVQKVTKQNCLADDCLLVDDLEYPVSSLPAEVIESLNKAIDDEYKARATYEAVINTLGSIRPFSMIIGAEEQHISSLKSLFDKYGIAIPDDPYDPDTLEIGDTLSANCQIGVDAEIANAALYKDELLPTVTNYEDITQVFTNLMDASQEKHLPAFEKCN